MKPVVLAALLLAGNLEAQTEKRLLVDVLTTLRGSLERLVKNENLRESAVVSIRHVDYFREAVDEWHPKFLDGGRGLRLSFERVLDGVKSVPEREPAAMARMRAIAEDLGDKRALCQAQGLDAKVRVEVRPKRGGLVEAPGLEVWYIEKFFALDPNMGAHRFPGFSSPAKDTIVPGRYMFWAAVPGKRVAGERVEQRVSGTGTAPVVLKIEVLAP